MIRTVCPQCGKHRPLNAENGWCAECTEQFSKYKARTADNCVSAPCFTPAACALAKHCKAIDD